MAQEIAATSSTEKFLRATSSEDAARTAGRFSKEQRNWIPMQQMPPIVQFFLHAKQWWQTKRVTARKEGTSLCLIGQLALGAKRHLALVEVDGVQFLVGGGAEQITVIAPVRTAPNGQAVTVCDATQVDFANENVSSGRPK